MKRHKGLVRAAQDELASIYSAPRGLPPVVAEDAQRTLTEAQHILDDIYAERRAQLRLVDGRTKRAAS